MLGLADSCEDGALLSASGPRVGISALPLSGRYLGRPLGLVCGEQLIWSHKQAQRLWQGTSIDPPGLLFQQDKLRLWGTASPHTPRACLQVSPGSASTSCETLGEAPSNLPQFPCHHRRRSPGLQTTVQSICSSQEVQGRPASMSHQQS